MDDPNYEHIGTIQVELKRAAQKVTELDPMADDFGGTELNTGPIHERSKKAGSHRVV